MLPLSDGIRAQRFPFVNVALIIANFSVWIFYELPHLNLAVFHASFYPCTVDGACRGPEPWGVSWFTAMFMHGSWDHILGNMLSSRSSARTSRIRWAVCVISPCTSSAASSQR
jgi:membrane associated rhomboid family serine protease